MKIKRLFYYLLLNIIVSAATMLLVLFLWQRLAGGGTPPVLSSLFGGLEPTPIGVNEIFSPGGQSESTEIPLRNYTIREDETIEDIAAVSGMTVDEILALNDLQNVDDLDAGTVILLPDIDVEATPPDTTEPSQEQGNDSPESPAPAAADAMVSINIVVAPGDLNEEYVEITGSGEDAIALQDWRLQDEQGNVFVFPEMTMYGSGSIRIYTRVGNSNPLKLYWGQSEAIWESGESVTLMDASGAVQSVFVVP